MLWSDIFVFRVHKTTVLIQKASFFKCAQRLEVHAFWQKLRKNLTKSYLQFRYPVRKLPEANDKTARDFKKIDEKNRFFSIFFKLSQTVSSDVKMVPKCFATLKATPKASGHILGSFEKNFQIEFSTFRSQFLLTWLLYTLKMAFYEAVQNLKVFSKW